MQSVVYTISNLVAQAYIKCHDTFVVISTKRLSNDDWDNVIYLRDNERIYKKAICTDILKMTPEEAILRYSNKAGMPKRDVSNYFANRKGNFAYVYLCECGEDVDIELGDIIPKDNGLSMSFQYVPCEAYCG